MTAYRVELTDPLRPNMHDVRDIDAETMGEAIDAVSLLVHAKHPNWRVTRAWLVPYPFLDPVQTDEIGGVPS